MTWRPATIPQSWNTDCANAARIVHCVNLHDELVEALERLLNAKTHDDSGMDYTDWSEEMKNDRVEYQEARLSAFRALSKAKGETP